MKRRVKVEGDLSDIASGTVTITNQDTGESFQDALEKLDEDIMQVLYDFVPGVWAVVYALVHELKEIQIKSQFTVTGTA